MTKCRWYCFRSDCFHCSVCDDRDSILVIDRLELMCERRSFVARHRETIDHASFSFSYAGRDSAAATATGIKSSHYMEQKNYMEQAMTF